MYASGADLSRFFWREPEATFGLAYRKESPRIAIATEPYPHRWTHHVLVERPGDIDDELMDWIGESRAFSLAKRRGGRR